MDFIDDEIRFFLQLLSELMRAFARVAEDDCHVQVHFIQMLQEQFELVRFRRFIDSLVDGGCRCLLRNVDVDGLVHVLPCEALCVIRHRCREKEDLTLLRCFINKRFDIFPESIGKHLICFIKDDCLYIGQIKASSSDMVEKTARSADNDSRIAFQLAQLVFDRASADDVSSVDIELDGKGAQHIKNLSGEFSRRRHDEDLRRILFCIHSLDYRQQVGKRLARTCLGTADDILPLENGRNGSLLDRGRLHDPLQFHDIC